MLPPLVQSKREGGLTGIFCPAVTHRPKLHLRPVTCSRFPGNGETITHRHVCTDRLEPQLVHQLHGARVARLGRGLRGTPGIYKVTKSSLCVEQESAGVQIFLPALLEHLKSPCSRCSESPLPSARALLRVGSGGAEPADAAARGPGTTMSHGGFARAALEDAPAVSSSQPPEHTMEVGAGEGWGGSFTRGGSGRASLWRCFRQMWS